MWSGGDNHDETWSKDGARLFWSRGGKVALPKHANVILCDGCGHIWCCCINVSIGWGGWPWGPNLILVSHLFLWRSRRVCRPGISTLQASLSDTKIQGHGQTSKYICEKNYWHWDLLRNKGTKQLPHRVHFHPADLACLDKSCRPSCFFFEILFKRIAEKTVSCLVSTKFWTDHPPQLSPSCFCSTSQQFAGVASCLGASLAWPIQDFCQKAGAAFNGSGGCPIGPIVNRSFDLPVGCFGGFHLRHDPVNEIS